MNDKFLTSNLLNLTTDSHFKAYFSNYNDSLRNILEEFLPLPKGSKIISAEMTGPNLLPSVQSKSGVDGKVFVLDIRAQIRVVKGNGKKRKEEINTVNIEMQTSSQSSFSNRSLAYACRLYSEQLTKGEDYDQLSSVYSLLFTTENLQAFSGLPDIYYHPCSVRRDEDGKAEPSHNIVLTEGIKFVVVELKKFARKIEECTSRRQKWCYLLKNSGELDNISARELAKEDEIMGDAVKNLHEISSDDKMRYELEAIEKFKHDQKDAKSFQLRKAKEEGMEKGVEKGREDERQATALKMIRKGFDLEIISECTGLSVAKLEKLRK